MRLGEGRDSLNGRDAAGWSRGERREVSEGVRDEDSVE